MSLITKTKLGFSVLNIVQKFLEGSWPITTSSIKKEKKGSNVYALALLASNDKRNRVIMIQLFAWVLTSKVRNLTGQGIHTSLLLCTRTGIKLEILEQQFALQRFFKRKGREYIYDIAVCM
jgi:hypothetical protein